MAGPISTNEGANYGSSGGKALNDLWRYSVTPTGAQTGVRPQAPLVQAYPLQSLLLLHSRNQDDSEWITYEITG